MTWISSDRIWFQVSLTTPVSHAHIFVLNTEKNESIRIGLIIEKKFITKKLVELIKAISRTVVTLAAVTCAFIAISFFEARETQRHGIYLPPMIRG